MLNKKHKDKRKITKFENEIIINDNPKAAFSESIKSIRANLLFTDLNADKKIIMVTSCSPAEGKSFISANLAASFAKEGTKVLIIDADLRKGRQHRIFGLTNNKKNGYSNAILNINRKDFNLKNYIKKTNIANLDLLNMGAIPPSPTELLASANNKQLLEQLKEKYDYIFLDCPPTLGLSDSVILSRLADYNIVVTSNKQTKIEQLQDVKKAFDKAQTKVTGVILNRVEKRNSHYYYGYYGE